MKNRMNSSFSPNHPGAIRPILQFVLVQNSCLGKELNKCCPPNSSDDLFIPFLSVFTLLLYAVNAPSCYRFLTSKNTTTAQNPSLPPPLTNQNLWFTILQTCGIETFKAVSKQYAGRVVGRGEK